MQCNETSPHTWTAVYFVVVVKINTGKDIEQRKFLHSSTGNVNYEINYRKQCSLLKRKGKK